MPLIEDSSIAFLAVIKGRSTGSAGTPSHLQSGRHNQCRFRTEGTTSNGSRHAAQARSFTKTRAAGGHQQCHSPGGRQWRGTWGTLPGSSSSGLGAPWPIFVLASAAQRNAGGNHQPPRHLHPRSSRNSGPALGPGLFSSSRSLSRSAHGPCLRHPITSMKGNLHVSVAEGWAGSLARQYFGSIGALDVANVLALPTKPVPSAPHGSDNGRPTQRERERKNFSWATAARPRCRRPSVSCAVCIQHTQHDFRCCGLIPAITAKFAGVTFRRASRSPSVSSPTTASM